MRAFCLFCGGDASEPDHWARCDGRQGVVEAVALEDALEDELEEDALEEDALEDADPVVQARASDPATSHESMARLDPRKMGRAEAIVIELHREHGPIALYQLRDLYRARTGHARGHMYQQARRVAGDHGRLRATGATVINPGTNRKQELWETCDITPPIIRKCPTCGGVIGREPAHAGAARGE